MDSKNIRIDPDKCIGCGSCAAIAPGAFEMNDDFKAKVLDVVTDNEETVKMGAESCPTQAITLSN